MTYPVLIVAPHPDDETLGCGGTLLKHQAAGAELHWVIVTTGTETQGYSPEWQARRRAEIRAVAEGYGFRAVHELGWPTTRLDDLPMSDLVQSMSRVFQEVAPHTVYLPFPGDVHTDHRVTFEAAAACTKSFRYPSIKRVLAYEVLSETDFGIAPQEAPFRPTVFVDISEYLEAKLSLMAHFHGELREFPFPRSETAIRAQAALRGVVAGCPAAEAFMLLKEVG